MNKKYFQTIREEILGNVIVFVLFILGTLINNHRLNNFNSKYSGKNAFEVMTVENGIAWQLLSISTVLVVSAIVILYFFIKKWKEIEGYSKITLLILGIVVIIFAIWIILEINNPILQSALAVLLVGSGIVFANE